MECLPVPTVPEGPEWTYEIKLDGYRLEAVRSAGETTLFSRRENVRNLEFDFIVDALKRLPDGTVIDGELVALDSSGVQTSICFKTSALRNLRSATSFSIFLSKKIGVVGFVELSERFGKGSPHTPKSLSDQLSRVIGIFLTRIPVVL